MRVSVERLRWGLLGGALLLIVVVGGFLAWGRYKALKTWRTVVQRSGAHITHDTNGFTYSQSFKGKTLFTLHAARAQQHPDGTWTLHDADMTLYSRTSDRVDHLYGAAFEYDPKTGVARADGEVHMDLQAPQALTPQRPPQQIRGREGRAPSAVRAPGESTQTIHVRTSGLVYMRTLGVAATKEDVEFSYGGMEAHARGAEFDEGQSTVHLLGDVRLDGELRGNPVKLRASRADLDRGNSVATLLTPTVTSEGGALAAQNAVLHLRKDGTVDRVEATGGVSASTGTRRVRGARLDVLLSERSLPQRGVLAGGVTLEDTSAERPLNGAADHVEMVFDAAGQPEVVTAFGSADRGQAANVAMTVFGVGHASLPRRVAGDVVKLTLAAAPGGDSSRRVLSQVEATGHAVAEGASLAAGAGPTGPKAGKGARNAPVRRLTTVAADGLKATFRADAANDPVIEHLWGMGHARLEQAASNGQRQASAADGLEVVFAPVVAGRGGAVTGAGGAGGQMVVASATETGHVTLRTEAPGKVSGKGAAEAVATVSTSAAERASFDGAAGRVLLNGGAQFRQNEIAVMANAIALDEATGDALADGGVSATLLGKAAAPGVAAAAAEATHVTSDRARFVHATQVAEFYGDTRPARLWHEASQVQAGEITLDGGAKTMSARPGARGGVVAAVFVGGGAARADGGSPLRKTSASAGDMVGGKPADGPGATVPGRVLRVTSTGLQYADARREAVFTGPVLLKAANGDVRAQRAVVFFTARTQGAAAGATGLAAADPASGTVDHAVASGDVRIEEPGRTGTGEQLLYKSATDSFVLTGTAGHAPRVVDEQQGTVTGATLMFGAADSSIVVSGTEGQGRRGRVRTETTVGKP